MTTVKNGEQQPGAKAAPSPDHVASKAPAQEPAVGRMVHYFDPSFAAAANDGMGKGPYSATILKVSPANEQAPVRLHLRVSLWGNDRWVSFLLQKGSEKLATDAPYWDWPARV